MKEASARGSSVSILVKRMLGVADDVAMRFQLPISSRNKNSLSFLFHTLSASLNTLCNELPWGAKEERGGLEDVVALIHSFGSYRLCFLRILAGLSERSSRQSLLESRMGWG